jgi:hypothetical protein
MGYPYGRAEWMPNPERFEVFKYCLASHAVLEPLVSKFVFCITLAPELVHRKDELNTYMHELFPADKLEIVWQRCDYGRDWRAICDKYVTDSDELVWLACNDDHIFIDHSLDMVRTAIQCVSSDPDPNACMYYSHWPEQMRMAHHLGGELCAGGDFVRYNWETFDGIMLLKASRLVAYWQRDYGDAPMFKVDYLGAFHGYKAPGVVYAPTKELVRHYEGYSHVNHNMPQHLANIVPPLFIPAGFFEHAMRLRIGHATRDNSAVNFNPAAEWLYNAQPSGTDYRWLEPDVPLFWQDRIYAIDHDMEYDVELMREARDAAFVAAARVPMRCFDIEFDHTMVPPSHWFRNHMLSNNY